MVSRQCGDNVCNSSIKDKNFDKGSLPIGPTLTDRNYEMESFRLPKSAHEHQRVGKLLDTQRSTKTMQLTQRSGKVKVKELLSKMGEFKYQSEMPEPSAVDQAEKILSMCENYKKKNHLNKQISKLGKQQKRKFKKMAIYVEEA